MFGHFTVDMTKAAVNTTEDVSFDELSVVGTWQNHYAQLTSGPTKDRDWGGSVHSALMCGTFVVLFPVGVIFLRLVEKVKWHAWMQGLGLVLIACGVGIGIWASGQYNNVGFQSPSSAQILVVKKMNVDEELTVKSLSI